MGNLSMVFDGAIIAIQKIERNKEFDCKNCHRLDDCDERGYLTTEAEGTKLIFCQVSISIANTRNEVWSSYAWEWALIDSEGYSYKGSTISCSAVKAGRSQTGTYITVQPKSRAKALLHFPELDDGIEISALTIYSGGNSSRIDISPIRADVQTLLSQDFSQPKDEGQTAIQNGQEIEFTPNQQRDYKLENNIRSFERTVLRLELQCHARMHNTLIPQEQVRLENEISNLVFSANQLAGMIPEGKEIALRERLKWAVNQYNGFMEKEKAAKERAATMNMKLDGLDGLTGKEFEEWTADLFRVLGFEVAVTPYTHDYGIDLVCEKDKKVTAVQCKRYTGVVSAPEVQKFIGALKNAGISRGYLVTTGVFSIGAEKAANGTNIVLCDKAGIQKLIDLATGAEPEYQLALF